MEKMVEEQDIVILGAGVAGLAVSYYLNQAGIKSVIYDKNETPGGLSRSFSIGDYYFDYGGHATFTKEKEIQEILENGVACREYIVKPYNFKKGQWIKHPVQNNLLPLSSQEKISVIEGYVNRPVIDKPKNYYEWLESVYGTYYTDNYPTLYTRKYWTVDPDMLETKWVGPRMYQSNLEEILLGAFEDNTADVHYSNGLRYPKNGGFGLFLKNMICEAEIYCKKEVTQINHKEKIVEFTDGSRVKYKELVSTIPLPELEHILPDVCDTYKKAMLDLNYTSLILVSLGLKKVNNIPNTSFYVYDEEILPARTYSTSNMSGKENEHVSFQAEVYTSKYKKFPYTLEEIKTLTIKQLIEMGVFSEDDVEISDVKFEKYANVIFTHDIYSNRECIHNYLSSIGIRYAGRFGDWDYLWTDQSMLSGKRVALEIIEDRK